MAAQVDSGPGNTTANTPSERFERIFCVPPREIGLAYALLRQICFVDREYPSEQINSLYFDTADLAQYVKSLSGDLQKDKVHIRKTSRSS